MNGDPTPTARPNGLHCVYGSCRGIPCNPGCSFTMTHLDPRDDIPTPTALATYADPRLDAVMAVIDGWAGTKTVESLAREVVAAADAVDPCLIDDVPPVRSACIKFDRATDEWVLRIGERESRCKRSKMAIAVAKYHGFCPVAGSVAIGVITLHPCP